MKLLKQTNINFFKETGNKQEETCINTNRTLSEPGVAKTKSQPIETTKAQIDAV